MTDKIKTILNAADVAIPQWRDARQDMINVYCRVLITRELRKMNVTFMAIRDIFGMKNHSTAVHYMTVYKEPIELEYLKLKFQSELLKIKTSSARKNLCDSCVNQECAECEIKQWL